MNTPVSFEIAKLLKEKGFDKPCLQAYRVWRGNIRKTDKTPLEEIGVEYEPYMRGYNASVTYYTQSESHTVAPTIAEVVMWLYEKHGIWIVILPELLNGTEIRYYPSVFEQGIGEDLESYFNSPTEAYEAAIEYVLKNLL
jgi:hypothetical protein